MSIELLALLAVVATWMRSPSVFPEWSLLSDVAFVAAAALASRRVAFRLSPLVGAAAIVIVLSNLAAPDAGAALASTAAWARLLLAAILGWSLLAAPGFPRRAAWTLAVSGAVMSAHAALQVFVVHPALAREAGLPLAMTLSLLDARGNSIFLLPAHLGAFLAVALVAASALATSAATTRRAHGAAAFLGAATLAGLFLAGSMGGALLAGGAIGVHAILGLRGRRRIALVATALVLPLLITAPSRMRRTAEIAREDPGSARTENWRTALRIIGEAPLLGCGGGGYANEHERLRSAAENDARHAHQAYLEAAAEHGLAMLALLAALVAFVGREAWCAFRSAEPGEEAAFLHASAATVLAHGLIDFGWSDPAWGLPAAMLVGASLGLRGGVTPVEDARWPVHSQLVAQVLSAFILCAGVSTSLAAMLERRALSEGEAGHHLQALTLLEGARGFAPLDAELPGLTAAAHLARARELGSTDAARREVLAAIADARAAVDASPRSAQARVTLAVALRAGGRRLEALAHATRATQLAPHRADARELRDALSAEASP